MKIAFVSQLDSKNVQSWSGTPFFMVQGLRQAGHSVKEIGPLHPPFPRFFKLLQKAYQVLTGKCYDFSRHPLLAKTLSKQAAAQMAAEDFDAVLCPSSLVSAGLDTAVPIVTWEDATFAGMVGYYPGKWQNFANATIRHGNQIQQASLSKAALSVFSSDWAAQSALSNYKVEAKNVVVVPLGANLTEVPSEEEVRAAIHARTQVGECRLLFIGVEWHRKGGDLVVQTALALREKGFNATVDVVGCQPVGDMPDCVRPHGFVSKSTAEGREKLRSLLLNSHYLFVPSIAECYGLVFAEASAFGVPSIARATGGIPTVVQNGLNGWALGVDESAQAYAELIAGQLESNETYIKTALRARKFYEERLNWRVAVASLESLLEPLVLQKC
ncbi:glycosyltransferase family 4 protein [Rhodoferax sp. U11-2br]|uniref:glycosyltransferase family 4 protein n=1 Tax=Rhodoferax sp. U11-2br TaxID=2838878 RepID=UPI001BE9C6EB|nr:glycosyltransferase family 4 protein [Rhodoferax sp. U11-2br]MBT3068272.1 glycosyltransferase family 4 protein [Rhodoferax sp. U11-2br]